ncbi:hypothetical protein B0H65DRAFT_452207 [Neurospora tetraspora]|uniref:Secreted protein n=1 Tax=Neurospora tetraspora TaxID=94610 RepID=A0AAE0JQA0_9PEZI|nr:hypothetical protein B0H65DRAFT_452207 [Neurospora tetraspora]
MTSSCLSAFISFIPLVIQQPSYLSSRCHPSIPLPSCWMRWFKSPSSQTATFHLRLETVHERSCFNMCVKLIWSLSLQHCNFALALHQLHQHCHPLY